MDTQGHKLGKEVEFSLRQFLKNRQKKEHILCSAVWFQDGKEHPHQPKNVEKGFVVCGMRHHNVFTTCGILGYQEKECNIQGFLTSKDRFVNRKEAKRIAEEAGQIISENVGDLLFSEDLYTEHGKETNTQVS